MRSRLLREYREVEETAPPPHGMGASGSWDDGGRTPVVLPLFFFREPGLPAAAKPRHQRLLPFPGVQGSSPCRLRHPLHPQPLEAPPLNSQAGALAFGRANGLLASPAPTPIRAGWNSPWNSPGQNTGVGSLSLLQGIFPTQGSNPGLPHCRWIL